MKLVCVAASVLLLSTGLAAQGVQSKGSKSKSLTITLGSLSCSTPVGTDTFNVTSWSLGATNTVDVSGGGGGTGKAVVSDLKVTKSIDGCSPNLLGAVVTGKHFPTLTLTDSNGDEIATTVTLTDVVVSSWQASGSASSDAAAESVSFAFSKFCLADGASGSKFCYDLKAAKVF